LAPPENLNWFELDPLLSNYSDADGSPKHR
jgi:hypothetical protein